MVNAVSSFKPSLLATAIPHGADWQPNAIESEDLPVSVYEASVEVHEQGEVLFVPVSRG